MFKAKELNINMIDENEYINMISQLLSNVLNDGSIEKIKRSILSYVDKKLYICNRVNTTFI